MLGLTTLALIIPLLSHTYAHRPPLPRAGRALTPAKRIEGLLGLTVRQLTCPNGYGLCHGGCCALNGGCCPTGDCCPFAPNTAECCSDGGCCQPGTYCVVGGCCENNEVCSGGGGTITVGGGGGGGEPPKTTTHQTTVKPPPTTAHEAPTTTPNPQPPTTTHKTTTSSDTDTFSAAPSSAPSGSATPPPAGPGTQNVVTSVDNTEITWVGAWESVSSGCNATSKAKRCTGENSLDASGNMAYTFTGYSIAMSFASSNVAYGVVINEKVWTFSETDTSNCTYDVVYQAGEARLIAVQVTIGQPHSGRRSILGIEERADDPWHLDLNDFVVQVADNFSSSSPSSLPASGATSNLRLIPAMFIITGLAIMSELAFILL
ncbi:hypothetical protein MVEN_00798100 [Mycena venus]|uniref:Uncharacterized protein n=1 Tax=Mycena venus TaxID=2733690 RepID=A0A8H6YLU6_9AGAR|nr:hypothetical protein MVEN_00798100 [Mycena venus]